MDTTLPSVANAARGPQPSAGLLDSLGNLPGRAKLMAGLAVVLLAAVAATAMMRSQQPEWRVLFANLSDKDGGAVIAALSQLNVQHRFSEGGGAVMVPASQVHEARLKLASQGLPKGGSVGFELMETQRFGITQFQERLNFQRGLEGELARSIMALSAVQSARIHLALPQQTAFLREQLKPSASVLLTLHSGRTLERGQIAGIVHLVASSVPELNPDTVSVVDQQGNLLSQNAGAAPNGLDSAQLLHVRQLEQGLAARVLAIVEPIVGVGNVKTQITADIDFTQSESTAEIYTPNQGSAPAAIRSQQLSEAPGAGGGAAQANANATGVAGVLSNQAPATAASPVNGAAPPLTAGGVAPAAGGVKRDAVTNYEVDKTVRVVRSASGVVKRLSAAVVLNHATVTASDGKANVTALSEAQIEQITGLVREAIGYNKERGDSLSVANAPFSVAPVAPPAAELPIWQRPEMLDLARNLGGWIALPLLALIIIFGLVRPALKLGRNPSSVPTLATTVQDPLSLPSPETAPPVALLGGQPTLQQAQLEDIRQLAKQNPGTVANVVRNWVNQPT